jgi:hypothetical protein
MSNAPTAETSVIDIPFLIRGRVVPPGEDGIVYDGRVGAHFRTPDPSAHARELVLADPGKLTDLQETPVDEIIDFLAQLSPRLTLDENPMMQAAFELALEAGELTEPVLRPVYDDFVSRFSRERLEGIVEKGIGKAYLDGWVEQGAPGRSSVRVRAIGVRQLHIIAGNVPIVAAITVIRSALAKADCLIKMPSNDPFTAAAIVQSMIDLDPDHPVTKHFAVAYWKGGDEEVEKKIIRPSRIEKLTAWGGMSSMRHIQRYLVPGIELIAFNPKLSISIVGHEALEGESEMRAAAYGVAARAGFFNQTACASTRVVYVECDTDEDDLERLERFGHAVHEAFGRLPAAVSTAPKEPSPSLDAELDALRLDDDFYRVLGDSSSAGVIVSRTEEPVEFADRLNNRIVNLVPVRDITRVPRWVNEGTQTVGVFPERLRTKLRDGLAIHGVQHILPLLGDASESDRTDIYSIDPDGADPAQRYGAPNDGFEPMRRMVRWVLDESTDLH